MKLKLKFVWIVAAGLIAMAAGGAAGAVETVTEPPAEAPQTAAVEQQADAGERPALETGRIVHIDPRTGRTQRPTQAQRAAMRERLETMVSRSSAGLIETASPRSGVMVNLLGRFRHATVLSVDGDGETASLCSAGAPAAALTGEEVDGD